MDPNPFTRRAFRWPWRSRSEVRAEVDEELRGHLEMRTEALVSRGLPPEEARRQAIDEFGDLAYTRQYCIEQGTRKEERRRRKLMLDELRQDVVIGCRRLWKTRLVAGAALVTLALGIGANTAVFSLVNAALLRPLPYRDADRLVLYYEGIPKAGLPKMGVSPPDFLDFARDQRTSAGLAIFQNNGAELGGDGNPERIVVSRVSPALFRVLGRKAALGRTFADDEDHPGADIVVLSHGLWQRHFGARRDVVGRAVILDRRPYVILGVMPPDFHFPLAGLPSGNDHAADAWIPFAYTAEERQARGMMYRNGVVGRLKPGATFEQARAELPVLLSRTFSDYPAELKNIGLALDGQVVPLVTEVTGDIRLPLLVLLASVGLVLLVACANVANLLLSRAAAREHEMAVMAALGASRGRLRQMLLTESAILGLASGVVGLAIAWAVTKAAPLALPDRLARLGDISPDVRVLAFTFAVSLVTALLFGLIPAGITSRPELQSALGSAGRGLAGGRRRRMLQQTLVVVTVGLSVVLLVGAGLLARSFGALLATDAGIRADHVLTATVPLPAKAYERAESIRAFFDRAIDGLRRMPGVQFAAASSDLPLDGREHLAFTPESSPVERARLPRSVAVTWPLGSYFQAHGIRLLAGRLFTAQDREGSQRVAVVSESFARYVWPGMDPIGKRIKWGMRASSLPWLTVVGVVGDVKDAALDAEAAIHAYEPYSQLGAEWLTRQNDFFRTMSISLRTTIDPRVLAGPLRREVNAIDPALAMSDVTTMDDRVAAAMGPQRLSAVLMLAFAGAALLMAAVGLYGVLAYGVAQRRREIGVRLALGARPREVVSLIARQGFVLTGLGLAIGLPCAFALARFMSALLYRTRTSDPVTLAGVPLVLGAVALLACYLPARRASRIDPVQALRTE